ncbi:MAG: SpoIIE family protein phosphatase [Blastocatellia bacterium]|nr:SpoIIE family protein phosphatase [Blastocatellia bacterium]
MLIDKTRWVWIVLFALSPLAYLVGSSLHFKYDPNLKIGFEVDRQSAIEEAARFARSKGINVTGWKSMCKVTKSDDLLFYYRLDKGREGQIARQLAPEIVVGVRFRSPDESESLEVQLGPDGRVLGYTRNFTKQRNVGEIAEPAARLMAVEAIKSRLAEHGLSSDVDLKLEEDVRTDTVIRKYTWKWPFTTIPELTVKSEISFRGGVLIGDTVKADVDSAFAKSNLNSESILKIVFGVAYGLLFAAALIFGLYRFVQRVKQQEISYSRIAMVTIIFASILSLFLLLTDMVFYDLGAGHDRGISDWLLTAIIYFSVIMFYVGCGLFIGLAYGSGEGDIRESYPGKLTSLDTLVTGRIFSQNVSRAFLIGCAMGGWLLWLVAEAFLPWQGKPGAGNGIGEFNTWFGYLPLMSPLIMAAMDVITITVIGLLIPLPFLNRRFHSRRAIIVSSSIFVWLACMGPYLHFRPWAPMLLMAAARAFFFLVAFFYFDLLTAMFCLAAPTSWSIILQMISQPSRGLHDSGVVSLILAGSSILTALVFAFRGKFYREDDVRPVYAERLAERVSMQAEVSAAREAQKRLMPERLPSLSNFSIAACCHPAHEVGGDFYDVFELEEGKLGILIAEGGGQGVGSALSIAFAKGFLTPRILGNGQSDNSPTEIMRGLQDRLAAMLDDEAGIGFAYAVIDAGDETLRYARVGTHPVIMIANEKSPGRLSSPEEREIKFKSDRRAEANISVIEGSYALGEGDSVAMLTDGIIKNWKNNNTTPDAELSKVLNNADGDDSAALQAALDKNIKTGSKRARKRMTDDDLTAVIVKLNQ